MTREVLLYGIAGGVLIVALRLAEYRFLVVEHSIEIYGALVAATFAGIGTTSSRSRRCLSGSRVAPARACGYT